MGAQPGSEFHAPYHHEGLTFESEKEGVEFLQVGIVLIFVLAMVIVITTAILLAIFT